MILIELVKCPRCGSSIVSGVPCWTCRNLNIARGMSRIGGSMLPAGANRSEGLTVSRKNRPLCGEASSSAHPGRDGYQPESRASGGFPAATDWPTACASALPGRWYRSRRVTAGNRPAFFRRAAPVNQVGTLRETCKPDGNRVRAPRSSRLRPQWERLVKRIGLSYRESAATVSASTATFTTSDCTDRAVRVPARLAARTPASHRGGAGDASSSLARAVRRGETSKTSPGVDRSCAASPKPTHADNDARHLLPALLPVCVGLLRVPASARGPISSRDAPSTPNHRGVVAQFSMRWPHER